MASGEEKPVHKWLIAGSVMTGTIMAVLDSSIVNVALPNMSGTLGATIEQITWVVTGYILANVIIMPLVALLSERFGRKNFYLSSVILFTVASMACGLEVRPPLLDDALVSFAFGLPFSSKRVMTRRSPSRK